MRAGLFVLGIRLSAIVVIELLVVAVLLILEVRGAGAAVLAGAAVVLAALVLVPVRGARIATWATVIAGYAVGRRVLTAPRPAARVLPTGRTDGAPDPITVPGELRAIFGELSARDFEIRDGGSGGELGSLGLIQSRGHWHATMSITAPDPDVLTTAPRAKLLVDRVLATLGQYAGALDAVQICERCVGADPARLAGSGLGQLAHDLAQSAPPIRLREVNVSVRIDPVQAKAAISARGGGVAGLGRLASAALSRVRAEAFSAGLLATPLDAVGALRAMSGGLLQPPSPDGQSVRWIESWKSIASAQVHHRSFVVTSWSDADLDALAAVPGYGLTISHEVQWRASSPTFSALTVIRLSALTAAQLETASHELRQAGRRLGVSMRLLRGRQAQALRLTLPGGQR